MLRPIGAQAFVAAEVLGDLLRVSRCQLSTNEKSLRELAYPDGSRTKGDQIF